MFARADSQSLRLSDPTIVAAVEVEQRMQDLDHKIRPLLKEKKKLTKIESELANVNFLIDSGIGSKAEQKALRQEKKKI